MRIRTDDQVQIISGKDSGKQGRVLRTNPKKQTVYVEDLNMIKRHQRAQPSPSGQGPGKDGGIIEMEGPIHVSNVAHMDPKDRKPTKVGYKTVDGAKLRFARKSGETIDR